MRRKPTPILGDDAAATRFAWGAAFFATIALVAVLGLARSAQALTLPAPGAPIGPTATPAAPDEDEAEEDEGEAESSEGDEFEIEECEDPEECEDDGEAGIEAPPECLLTQATATVTASPESGKVRIAVRYETSSPVTVAVDSWLRGGKGPLSLDGERKHFGRSGTIHLTESLDEPQMEKVVAARDFTVRLRPAGAPRYCNRLLDRRLSAKHAEANGLSWSDPRAALRR